MCARRFADPLGGAAIDRITRYWTPFQRNTQLIPLQGILLANRVLVAGSGARFSSASPTPSLHFAYPRGESHGSRWSRRRNRSAIAQTLPVAHPVFSPSSVVPASALAYADPVQETTKNVFFLVLMLAGVLFAVFTAAGVNNPWERHSIR